MHAAWLRGRDLPASNIGTSTSNERTRLEKSGRLFAAPAPGLSRASASPARAWASRDETDTERERERERERQIRAASERCQCFLSASSRCKLRLCKIPQTGSALKELKILACACALLNACSLRRSWFVNAGPLPGFKETAASALTIVHSRRHVLHDLALMILLRILYKHQRQSLASLVLGASSRNLASAMVCKAKACCSGACRAHQSVRIPQVSWKTTTMPSNLPWGAPSDQWRCLMAGALNRPYK